MTSNERNCAKKVTYDTPLAALAAAAKAQQNNGLSLTPYQCSICGNYHLTKSDGWNVNGITGDDNGQ